MHSAIERLKARRIRFEAGLTDEEVRAIEAGRGWRFPADLRRFLQAAMPVGAGFFDWRTGAPSQQRETCEEELHRGILYDVEHNGLWLASWGPPPGAIGDALREARRLLGEAPALIPLRFRHYLPSHPAEGAPVLFVRQSDVRIIARDLAEYLHDLPDPDGPTRPSDEGEPVLFWTDLAREGTVRLPFFARTTDGDASIDYVPLEQAARQYARSARLAPHFMGQAVWFSQPPAAGDALRSLFRLIRTDPGWLLASGRKYFFVADPENMLPITRDLLERWPDAALPEERFPRLDVDEAYQTSFGLIDLDMQSMQLDVEEARVASLHGRGWRPMRREEEDVIWEQVPTRFDNPTQRGSPVPSSCVWDVSVIYLAPTTDRDRLIEDLNRKTQNALRKCTAPGEELCVLDWNHPCFWHDPHAEIATTREEGRAVPVFPNGDSYLYLARDFGFGIFGNCRDLTLTIQGVALMNAFAEDPPLLFQRRTWNGEQREAMQEVWRRRGWTCLETEQGDHLWDRFQEHLGFRRDSPESDIREPVPSLTWDLSAFLSLDKHAFVLQAADLTRKVLNAFQRAAPDEATVYALDGFRWYEHYTFHPHQIAGVGRDEWAHVVWPDDNYAIFFSEDMSFGLFGDPVRKTLCIWGAEMLQAVEGDLPVCLDRPIRRDGRTIPT